MARWLTTLVALPEDLSSVPNIHVRWLQLPVTLASGDPTLPSRLHGQACIDMTYTHIETHSQVKKKKKLTE